MVAFEMDRQGYQLHVDKRSKSSSSPMWHSRAFWVWVGLVVLSVGLDMHTAQYCTSNKVSFPMRSGAESQERGADMQWIDVPAPACRIVVQRLALGDLVRRRKKLCQYIR